MTIIETKDFLKELGQLPTSTQKLYQLQKQRLLVSLQDPRLHTKKLVDLDGVHSFRITIHYRGLFYLQNPDTLILFSIGHRKDVYR